MPACGGPREGPSGRLLDVGWSGVCTLLEIGCAKLVIGAGGVSKWVDSASLLSDNIDEHVVEPFDGIKVASKRGEVDGHAHIWPNRIWPKTAFGQQNPNLARSFS